MDEAALFELPADLRQPVLDCAKAYGVPIEFLLELYRRGFATQVGDAGGFPWGKLDPDDQGELTVAIAVDRTHRVVRMEFGKRVSWLALPPNHARHLAAKLVEFAVALDRAGLH